MWYQLSNSFANVRIVWALDPDDDVCFLKWNKIRFFEREFA